MPTTIALMEKTKVKRRIVMPFRLATRAMPATSDATQRVRAFLVDGSAMALLTAMTVRMSSIASSELVPSLNSSAKMDDAYQEH
jgi:hypothetical protein